jgi:hypothetical protein
MPRKSPSRLQRDLTPAHSHAAAVDNLRERYISHRVLDDYEAVLDAVCRAWNRLLDETGRLASLTAYSYLTASAIP